MHAERPGRGARGFTLVEVLVAMMIMAIMAGMAWRGVDGIVRTRDANQARLEKTLRLNSVIAQWDVDLSQLQDSDAVPQAIQCDGRSVRLVRRAPDGLQVVAWSWRPDDSGGAWVRWASPAVRTTGELTDLWLKSLQLQGTEAGSLRTLTGMNGWQVYFYQTNGWANCQSTGNLQVEQTAATTASTASSAAAGSTTTASSTSASTGATGTTAVKVRVAPPGGVRIVLNMAPGSGLAGDLVRDSRVGP